MTTVAPLVPMSTTHAGNANQALSMQVLARTPAARDTVTFALGLPGTARAPAAYLPGQFVTLALATTAETTLYRSYSLCGDSRADSPWEITVKRVPGGLISNFLLDQLLPGMLLHASSPQGGFTLPATLRSDTPLIFVAGGSGITPVYSMLRALARLEPAQRPPVWLHYAYHSPADAICGYELAALDPLRDWLTQSHYVTTCGSRLRTDQLLATHGAAATAAEWYVSGPASLRRSVEEQVLGHGVSAERYHAEVFASPTVRHAAHVSPTTTAQHAARVRLADSGAILVACPEETLLETLERHGYRPTFSCRAGACGTCHLRLIAGQVRQDEAWRVFTPAERAAGLVLSCVAEPLGDITLATAGKQVVPPIADVGRTDVPPRPAATHTPNTRRHTAKRKLRGSLAAAAVGLFVVVWGASNHSTDGSFSRSGSATPPSSQTGGGSSSSSFSTQPGQASPNASTGVS
jgi:ferredoxin-NADP reductase